MAIIITSTVLMLLLLFLLRVLLSHSLGSMTEEFWELR